eukprot:2323315-Amphidinium_carterae.1
MMVSHGVEGNKWHCEAFLSSLTVLFEDRFQYNAFETNILHTVHADRKKNKTRLDPSVREALSRDAVSTRNPYRARAAASVVGVTLPSHSSSVDGKLQKKYWYCMRREFSGVGVLHVASDK